MDESVAVPEDGTRGGTSKGLRAGASAKGDPVADAVLLGRVRKGDRSAFDELFRRHAHPAWRLGMAVGGSAEVAEQALVEAFTSVVRHVESGTASIVSPFRELLVRETLAVAAAEARSGIARAATGETTDPNAVISAYRSLPDQWRTVLWLSSVEGGSAKQIGSLLGQPAEATARLAARARAGLRRRFTQAGAAADDPLLADLGAALRPLVAPMPATVPAAAAAWWLAWRDTTSSERRHGLGALVPFGPWAEKALAGATAGILTAGIAAAVALGGREATRRSPQLAAPAGSGELAGGGSTAPTGGGGGSSAPSSVRAHNHGTLARAEGGAATDPGSAVPVPVIPPAAGLQTKKSGAPKQQSTTDNPPPAQAPPAPGASVAVNLGGVPVGVSVGPKPGVQAGTVSAGNPPPPSSGPVAVQVVTGVLPTITVTLP